MHPERQSGSLGRLYGIGVALLALLAGLAWQPARVAAINPAVIPTTTAGSIEPPTPTPTAVATSTPDEWAAAPPLDLLLRGPGLPVAPGERLAVTLALDTRGQAVFPVTVFLTLDPALEPLGATTDLGACILDRTIACDMAGAPARITVEVQVSAGARAGQQIRVQASARDAGNNTVASNRVTLAVLAPEGASTALQAGPEAAPATAPREEAPQSEEPSAASTGEQDPAALVPTAQDTTIPESAAAVTEPLAATGTPEPTAEPVPVPLPTARAQAIRPDAAPRVAPVTALPETASRSAGGLAVLLAGCVLVGSALAVHRVRRR